MVWQMPDAVCAVLNSGWWTEKALKHVQRLTEINKLRNVTSCWLYSENIALIHVVWVPSLLQSDHRVDRTAGEKAALTVAAAYHEKRVTVWQGTQRYHTRWQITLDQRTTKTNRRGLCWNTCRGCTCGERGKTYSPTSRYIEGGEV